MTELIVYGICFVICFSLFLGHHIAVKNERKYLKRQRENLNSRYK